MEDVIQLIKESVLTSEQRESLLLDNSSAQKELDKQVEALVNAFYGVLKTLAFTDEVEEYYNGLTPAVSQLIGTPVSRHRKSSSANHIPVLENRLLTTLSNCQYAQNVIVNRIGDSFSKSGYSLSKSTVYNFKSKLASLEKSILDAYLEQKSDPLIGTIEPSMYLGRFDWDTDVTPTDISPYAKECINNLIHVHSEVSKTIVIVYQQGEHDVITFNILLVCNRLPAK